MRFISTIALWSIALAIAFSGYEIFFWLLISAFGLIALWEYYRMLDHAGIPNFRITAMICGALMLGAKVWQEVKILRALALPAQNTYQIDYQTTRHNYNDEGAITTNWRATMQVIVGKPTETNPLGLFVTSLDFSPEAQQ